MIIIRSSVTIKLIIIHFILSLRLRDSKKLTTLVANFLFEENKNAPKNNKGKITNKRVIKKLVGKIYK